MKYVMLICSDARAEADYSEQEQKQVYDAIFAHIEKWQKLGRYVEGGHQLQPPGTARTIRQDAAGGTVVTDGPYVEIKELIGGFMIIEADSIEEAIETASEWPGIAYGAVVEVRPVVVF